ncbi:DUF6702 family protein [Nonlabens agnitus]|uniref:Uncharacterized protein n=1 Tax=Nonlabens agnitus TaxID=870484 RepID=A0A2S9WX67_9FLAO|nr:DUF6702 family protein [Nonlabens agnitus]PRP68041.1 hypothetical protein BST86_13545 [Nonlabens agnitus]
MKLTKVAVIITVLFGALASTASTIKEAFDLPIVVEGSRFRESELIQQYHKYYLSVSNVKYNEKSKALQMVSRFFIDDLEDVLNERMDKKVTLGNPDGLEELKPILNRYINSRLRVKADGTTTDPTVIGAEYDADQIIIYIELPAAKQPKTVEVSYKALFELFPEQKNLVHFKMGSQRKSLLNSMDTPTDRVNF